MDHSIACKDTKVSVSSVITNPDLIKLDDASYFNGLGYDIYNESSSFYTDNCAPASINGNDITLEDRKKDFYPSNISLCNESCSYANVDLEAKRFTCECDTVYNDTDNNKTDEEKEEENNNNSYLDYFLSLINYKIAVCYELFYDYKSYYYNAGFYIAVGTLLLCLCGMITFLTIGIKTMNIHILENTPNKKKLIQSFKGQLEKIKEFKNGKHTINAYNPPPKRRFMEKKSTEIYNKEKLNFSKTNKNKVFINRKSNKTNSNNDLIHSQKNKTDTLNSLLALSARMQKKEKKENKEKK